MKSKLLCCLFLAILVASPVLAGDRAKGVFQNRGLGKNIEVPIADAYAHLGKAEFGSDTVILVHLSTQPLDHAEIDASLDRVAAFTKQAANHSPQLTLAFNPETGKLRGASYYLRSGNGCGYCSMPDVPGAVLKIEGGALKGHLNVKPTDHSDGDGAGVDIQFDLPIASEPKTTDLGADGGVPGKALVACAAAVAKKDATAFRTHCGLPADYFEQGNERAWMLAVYDRSALQLLDLRVTGGRALATEAEVFVEGKVESSNASYKGSVFMKKTSTGWAHDREKLEYDH